LSTSKNSKDAEDILSEFQDSKKSEPPLESPEPEPPLESPEPEPQLESPEPEPQLESPEPEPQLESPEPEPQLESPEPEMKSESVIEQKTKSFVPAERNVIYVGTKPIMSYVAATLTQLSTFHVVTIKARGKRITQAVDVSQMIVKRMDTVGYKINDVRILSESLTSQDGKKRNVSTIELDITKE